MNENLRHRHSFQCTFFMANVLYSSKIMIYKKTNKRTTQVQMVSTEGSQLHNVAENLCLVCIVAVVACRLQKPITPLHVEVDSGWVRVSCVHWPCKTFFLSSIVSCFSPLLHSLYCTISHPYFPAMSALTGCSSSLRHYEQTGYCRFDIQFCLCSLVQGITRFISQMWSRYLTKRISDSPRFGWGRIMSPKIP